MMDDLNLQDAVAAADTYGSFDENGDYFIPPETFYDDVRLY